MKKQARTAKSSLTKDTVRDHFRQAKEFLKKLKHIEKEVYLATLETAPCYIRVETM